MKLNHNSPHILVIDDDKRIRDLLRQYLNEQGYLVSIVANTLEAREFIKAIKFDLMILDLMLPGENGLDFLKSLRIANISSPVIMLTASSEIENKLNGLELGADDYLIKPFDPKELLLRIKNIIKRTSQEVNIIFFGEYSYNLDKKILFKNNKIVNLTLSESQLLDILIINRDKVISREYIANNLNVNERSIDVQMVRLRNKVDPMFLQTIRNQGYLFRVL
jgi:two-component system, OmpR family, phosphate regulon response regulator OmpR